ncbi:tRNA (cytidine/uridine-2'-O)-ribose methyltransferase [Gammaproteobacteria bacterium]
MFDVVLFEPEIPPNTGNIIRLCANSGTRLHLIRPLGFELSDSKLRRAGLDYHEWVSIVVHDDLAGYLETARPPRVWALSTRGKRSYTEADVAKGDALLFGPETRGLPAAVIDAIAPSQQLRIPMIPGNRSLNLSNAVAIVVYDAWRRHHFVGGDEFPII